MRREKEPTIESILDSFMDELSAATEAAKSSGTCTTIQELPHFGEVAEFEFTLGSTLSLFFGLDFDHLNIAGKYTLPGGVKVTLVATNDPEVFIGEYTYKDGRNVWKIQPWVAQAPIN